MKVSFGQGIQEASPAALLFGLYVPAGHAVHWLFKVLMQLLTS